MDSVTRNSLLKTEGLKMEFIDYCRDRGLLLNHVNVDGRWNRVPTVDHPNKRNGAYRFLGGIGFVQNHATMTGVETWRGSGDFDAAKYREIVTKVNKQNEQRAFNAATKARELLSKSVTKKHNYMHLKGWYEHAVNVYQREDMDVAIIPMFVNGNLSSLQEIYFQDAKWHKKFLFGGITKNAIHVIGNGSVPIYCEGFATGVTVFHAARKAGISCQVVVCFSANNMIQMATKKGIVIADNDESLTGENAARKIGLPYWVSKKVGNDFNDDYIERGLFAVANELKLLGMKL